MLPEFLHLDEHLLVINKPAGLPVLPDGWQADAPYLVRMLEAELGRTWVVHRLDKVTSGVMVFARTAEAHRDLSLQFERHAVVKTYHAIVNGIPAWEQHSARHPLRVNVGHSHRTAVDHGRGKPSQTDLTRLERLAGHALVAAEPRTGRTHQIRVHLYALGHPILGDLLYSAPPTRLIDRPALHARTLGFTHPATGAAVRWEAPYPSDFATAMQQLAIPR